MKDRADTNPPENEYDEREPLSDAEESAADLDEETIELSEQAAELVRRLEAERDEALAARARALADYSNFQRRSAENEARALTTGASRVVRSIMSVLDNFELALDQDHTQVTVDQLAAGVKLVHEELCRALETHGVRRIAPEIGSEFDPNRHEAMFRERTDDHAPNSIVSVLQPGYAMGDLVLRPAKVSVSQPVHVRESE